MEDAKLAQLHSEYTYQVERRGKKGGLGVNEVYRFAGVETSSNAGKADPKQPYIRFVKAGYVAPKSDSRIVFDTEESTTAKPTTTSKSKKLKNKKTKDKKIKKNKRKSEVVITPEKKKKKVKKTKSKTNNIKTKTPTETKQNPFVVNLENGVLLRQAVLNVLKSYPKARLLTCHGQLSKLKTKQGKAQKNVTVLELQKRESCIYVVGVNAKGDIVCGSVASGTKCGDAVSLVLVDC